MVKNSLVDYEAWEKDLGIKTMIFSNLWKKYFPEAPRNKREVESHIWTLDLDDDLVLKENA